ncbi:MAG: single-stranded DNA-binding protein [Nitrospirota bacterium]|nr:single-stranded DNA-binding protein [Nitrospirota bacterium]
MDQVSSTVLEGNLTRNPELRYTDKGTPVCSFTVANNRQWKSGDEKKEEVCFIDVVVFGKHGETCAQYLVKGQGVMLVNARLKQERWEMDGQKKSKHVLHCQEVKFRGKPKEGQADGGAPSGENPDGAGEEQPWC